MLDEFIFPLACQAIPRLCGRFDVECSLPEELFPVGVNEEDVASLNSERERILGELVSKHGVSIWDLFDESGIGQERNAIARDAVRKDSPLLDVATGRGYFAFASARLNNEVTAVDVMDGEQRVGWWRVFMRSSRQLGLASVVNAIRSDGTSLPLAPERFAVVSCIHAIRNFLVLDDHRGVMAEMHRTTAKGGKAVLAESSMEAESPSEEVYVAYIQLRARIGWEVVPPGSKELEQLMEEAGFTAIASTKKRFGRDYAPVEFPSFVIAGQPPTIREEHDRIEKMRSKCGISATRVILVSGKRES
jgi:ubiquinone/menaquinone biosynthesis C-methylase UbiE